LVVAGHDELVSGRGRPGCGQPEAVALLRPGPDELGQVSAEFARLAGTLKREDELRAAWSLTSPAPVTILQGGTEELLDGSPIPLPPGSPHCTIRRCAWASWSMTRPPWPRAHTS
jgi:hypothetical protein